MAERASATYLNALVLKAHEDYNKALERFMKALGQDGFVFPEMAPLEPTFEMLDSEEPLERDMALGAVLGEVGAMRNGTNGSQETAQEGTETGYV